MKLKYLKYTVYLHTNCMYICALYIRRVCIFCSPSKNQLSFQLRMHDVEECTIYAVLKSTHSSYGLLMSTYTCGKDIKERFGMVNNNFRRQVSLQRQRTEETEIGDRGAQPSGMFQVETPRGWKCSSSTL